MGYVLSGLEVSSDYVVVIHMDRFSWQVFLRVGRCLVGPREEIDDRDEDY